MLMWFLTSLHWLVSSAYSTTSRGSCHAPNVTHHTPRTICHRLTSRAARFISCATSRHYINCYSFIYLRVCQPKKKKEHEKLFFLKAPFRRKTLTSKSKLTRNGIRKKTSARRSLFFCFLRHDVHMIIVLSRHSTTCLAWKWRDCFLFYFHSWVLTSYYKSKGNLHWFAMNYAGCVALFFLWHFPIRECCVLVLSKHKITKLIMVIYADSCRSFCAFDLRSYGMHKYT